VAQSDTHGVYLIGGPCDGRTIQVSFAQIRTAWVKCDGTVYHVTHEATGGYSATAAKEVEPPAGQNAAAASVQVSQAWSHFMWFLAFRVREYLARQERARTKIMRALQNTTKGSRVR